MRPLPFLPDTSSLYRRGGRRQSGPPTSRRLRRRLLEFLERSPGERPIRLDPISDLVAVGLSWQQRLQLAEQELAAACVQLTALRQELGQDEEGVSLVEDAETLLDAHFGARSALDQLSHYRGNVDARRGLLKAIAARSGPGSGGGGGG
jgi:hypothetical protein